MSLEPFVELIETLRTAKLRTAVTALSVAWGIFMLVILLAAGAGIQNGAEHEFRDDATNSIWVYRGTTSIPFEGHKIGRPVKLDDDDYDAIRHEIDGVEQITGRFYIQSQFTVSYRGTVSSFDVRACHPGHRFIENTQILEGRFINELDLQERRKVAVIGPIAVDRLFHKKAALGEWIDINGTMYRVVGIFDDDGGEEEQAKIYIPIATAQMAYGGPKQIHQIMFTIGGDADTARSEAVVEETKRLLARRHHYAVTDKSAVRVRNTIEDFQRVLTLFARIRFFIWIVGFGTIVAGIVGVSNIMLISVRERTKEIGIRKALGATPWKIVSQILLEALVVTGTSGYVGLVAGLALVEVVRRNVPPSDYFRNPEVNLGVAAGATVLLVFAGLLAGYFPARLAAKVSPIVALRAE
ncbi:MAG TPA: ABC transporter permease [Polyangiaceae bacterium]|jgi:putative ABC transport system permease protein|nr:ABC transporter permease [Polyangiaceae bacterium]